MDARICCNVGHVATNINNISSGSYSVQMDIRLATPNDASAISALIRGVAHYFTLHPDGSGAEEFLKSISVESIEGFISKPNFRYFVGLVDMELAGVAAVRDNKHLFHLFVSSQFQRKGLARELWNFVLHDALLSGNSGEFTVNSTPFAVPVYASFGFETVGEKVETRGIAFVPMKLLLNTRENIA